MTKHIVVSDEISKELDKLKGDKDSYSQVIKSLLDNQPKTDAERLYILFEPFNSNICKILGNEIYYPIELFRIICVKLMQDKYKFKERVNKLIVILEQYLNDIEVLDEQT